MDWTTSDESLKYLGPYEVFRRCVYLDKFERGKQIVDRMCRGRRLPPLSMLFLAWAFDRYKLFYYALSKYDWRKHSKRLLADVASSGKYEIVPWLLRAGCDPRGTEIFSCYYQGKFDDICLSMMRHGAEIDWDLLLKKASKRLDSRKFLSDAGTVRNFLLLVRYNRMLPEHLKELKKFLF